MILHLYFLFMLLLAGGLLEGCRRILRKDRIARGVK